VFNDREDAAGQLASRLESYRGGGTVIAALARGAIPMGCALAEALDAELYVLVVRKIGAPGNPELAIGAISDGRSPDAWLNRPLIRSLGISQRYIDAAIQEQSAELKRRQEQYATCMRNPDLAGRRVILTDDGMATGASMRMAVRVIERQNPACCIVAVPVAARDAVVDLASEVDEMICLEQPEPFIAVGAHYARFDQVDDDEVLASLRKYDRRRAGVE
jgi:predicted phosphoribosyltransferase